LVKCEKLLIPTPSLVFLSYHWYIFRVRFHFFVGFVNRATLNFKHVNIAWGGFDLLRTIVIGSCVSVQGTFVRGLPDGRILVRVGDREFAGMPVPNKAA
jgi:hypothetical protein